ncbi:MAG: 4Fe-4S dicluster domain-containing protein [Stappiaceae bacterium]
MSGPAKIETDLSRRSFLLGGLGGDQVVHASENCLAFQGIACRSCEDSCSVRAIRFRPKLGGPEHPAIDAEICTACGECVSICPVNALTVVARKTDA